MGVIFTYIMENKLTNFMFDRVNIPSFRKYLDLTSLRHRITSGNVANIATPGYKARSIDFQAEFDKMTKSGNKLVGLTTHRNHIPLGSHQARPPKIEQAKIVDGEINSVDIDKEMAGLAQNELRFTIAAKLLQLKFAGLRKAITSK